MKTTHLFEEACYIISNRAVAKCFLFGDEKDCKRFKVKMDLYLSPLCDILSYGFAKDEFKIVVRLKSRRAFESYFKTKYPKLYAESKFIPETTYIFAQAMANLQSGYAKYFNYRYERDGGLMKSRYMRALIESEQELKARIQAVHEIHEDGKRSRIWTFRRKEAGFNLESIKDSVIRSSAKCYGEGLVESGLKGFRRLDQLDLRGQFENLPPKKINFKSTAQKHKNLISFFFHEKF